MNGCGWINKKWLVSEKMCEEMSEDKSNDSSKLDEEKRERDRDGCGLDGWMSKRWIAEKYGIREKVNRN